MNTVEDGREVHHPPDVVIATEVDDRRVEEQNTGIDIDQEAEEVEENFDAYGTMRPFKQADDDVVQHQISAMNNLASGPIEDDGKFRIGDGLVRAKKLR